MNKVWQVSDQSHMARFGSFNLYNSLDFALRQAVATAEDAGLEVVVSVGFDGPYKVIAKHNKQMVFTVEEKEVL